ncbi:sulfite exporter TauE/SafE family protein [Massilia sp. MB5]|uniref:sulfite exporter TauE/SafE family protein n=1 Tax=Massilia sp. MB5 TaxID=2919578 RepID=UPI001F0F04DB|nr:sulfite exporter TauE/SafE family protein [Massilia sp. MB5]UMR31783.1 sulfite exporter TauE/SafE family protein [Massilia sp. MB5]
MSGLNLLPVFAVGLAGSVHCIGMCGGIVGALSAAQGPARRVIPIAPAAGPAGLALPQAIDSLARVFAYNAGRIGSYMLAGAIAGGLAGGAVSLARLTSIQTAGLWAANLMLAALGLYLMDAWRGLARLEAAGGRLWRHVQPLMKPLLPMDTPLKALALGGLWGWLPCGMVYSVLLTAMLSGSAASGAAVMCAFGLGTLPMLLGLGLAGARVRQYLQQRQVRIACGLLVLGFGLLGLLRASGLSMPLLDALGLTHGAGHGWLDTFCVTPRP